MLQNFAVITEMPPKTHAISMAPPSIYVIIVTRLLRIPKVLHDARFATTH